MPKGKGKQQGRVGCKGGFNGNTKKNVKLMAPDPKKDQKSENFKAKEQREKPEKMDAEQKLIWRILHL